MHFLSRHLPFTVLAIVGALAAAVPAQAQSSASSAAQKASPSTEGVAWSGLTPAQRQALSPLERDWNGIDASRKTKWLDIAARMPKMPADEQKRLQERMTEWARLSPAERGRARLSFQEAKQLSPAQRQARWEAYQALPDTERKALAARAASRASAPSTSASSSLALTTKQSSQPPKPTRPVVQSVAPTLVQAKPGATTTLIGKGATPPAHQMAGQPKIAAKPGQVDRATLLPKAAATAAPPRPAASQAVASQS